MPRFIPRARTSHDHSMILVNATPLPPHSNPPPTTRPPIHPPTHRDSANQPLFPPTHPPTHAPTLSLTPQALRHVDKNDSPNTLLWRSVRVYLTQVPLHIWISTTFFENIPPHYITILICCCVWTNVQMHIMYHARYEHRKNMVELAPPSPHPTRVC